MKSKKLKTNSILVCLINKKCNIFEFVMSHFQEIIGISSRVCKNFRNSPERAHSYLKAVFKRVTHSFEDIYQEIEVKYS